MVKTLNSLATLASYPYEDRPIAIGHGQTISQPFIVAYMTDMLDISPLHTVLEIGMGSGYQSAVLSKLAHDVYTVEIIKGGNSVLSGSGHFGGTVHLFSKSPDKNTIYILRNIGISDDRDQDFSGALNLRAGPLGFAGQFSGKSRLFDGRTLYTTLFTTMAALVDLPNGKISARFLSLSNSLKYPTGFVNTTDSLSLNQFKFKGQIFKIKGVEIVYGTRTWRWIDTFLTILIEIYQKTLEEFTFRKPGCGNNGAEHFSWNRSN